MQLQAKLMEQRFRLARAEQAIREEDVKAERADKAKQNRELPGPAGSVRPTVGS
jgi:hypothetical protein